MIPSNSFYRECRGRCESLAADEGWGLLGLCLGYKIQNWEQKPGFQAPGVVGSCCQQHVGITLPLTMHSLPNQMQPSFRV